MSGYRDSIGISQSPKRTTHYSPSSINSSSSTSSSRPFRRPSLEGTDFYSSLSPPDTSFRGSAERASISSSNRLSVMAPPVEPVLNRSQRSSSLGQWSPKQKPARTAAALPNNPPTDAQLALSDQSESNIHPVGPKPEKPARPPRLSLKGSLQKPPITPSPLNNRVPPAQCTGYLIMVTESTNSDAGSDSSVNTTSHSAQTRSKSRERGDGEGDALSSQRLNTGRSRSAVCNDAEDNGTTPYLGYEEEPVVKEVKIQYFFRLNSGVLFCYESEKTQGSGEGGELFGEPTNLKQYLLRTESAKSSSGLPDRIILYQQQLVGRDTGDPEDHFELEFEETNTFEFDKWLEAFREHLAYINNTAVEPVKNDDSFLKLMRTFETTAYAEVMRRNILLKKEVEELQLEMDALNAQLRCRRLSVELNKKVASVGVKLHSIKPRNSSLDETEFNIYSHYREFSKRQLDRYRDVFYANDTSGRGRIDLDGLERVMHELGFYLPREKIAVLLGEGDEDGDDAITFTELLTIFRRRQKGELLPQSCAEEQVNIFDPDFDVRTKGVARARAFFDGRSALVTGGFIQKEIALRQEMRKAEREKKKSLEIVTESKAAQRDQEK